MSANKTTLSLNWLIKGHVKVKQLKQPLSSLFCFCRILGTRSISLPLNEPPTNLDKNSVDLQKLKSEIQRVQNDTLEIPCIVGGKEIYTGNTAYQVVVRQYIVITSVWFVLSTDIVPILIQVQYVVPL